MLHFLMATWLTASAADGVTTFMATKAGARETNPFFKTPEALALEKAAVGIGSAAIAYRWEKQHPKLVRVMAIAAATGYTAAAIHNWQVYQSQRGQ